jgi:hypothetical protein
MYPRVWNKVVVVAREDEDEAMLNLHHAEPKALPDP